MQTKKVLLLAAGRGTRMGEHTDLMHKALLPLGQTAILSHILAQFSLQHEFVICVGYRGEDIRNYVAVTHPNLHVGFVEVDQFQGPDSGPGYTAYCARHLLQEPFFLVCTDTLWSEPLPDTGNWMGTKSLPESERPNYCNLAVSGSSITRVGLKKSDKRPDQKTFVGLAHIKDWQPFFEGFADEIERRKQDSADDHEIKFRSGFENIIRQSVLNSCEISSWVDVGRRELYEKARSEFALIRPNI